jgi:WD40 repeat protein/uncharacterized caspase-like protein
MYKFFFLIGATLFTFVNAPAQTAEVVVQLGHSDGVSALCYSPDGKYLVSGGGDNTIKIWDMSNGLLLRTLIGHKQPIKSVAVSKDSKRIASGSEDNSIKIWELSTGNLLHTLKGHKEDVERVCYNNTGLLMASAGEKEIKIWNASTGVLIKTITGHTEDIGDIAFSPDGSTIVAGDDGYGENTIKFWEVSSGKLLRTFKVSKYGIVKIAYSPDGQKVTYAAGSGFNFGEVGCINALSGTTSFSIKDSSGLRALAYNKEGKKILYGGYNNKLITAEALSGKILSSVSTKASGPVKDIVFSTDGKYMACAMGWRIYIYDNASGKQLRDIVTLNDHVWSLSLSNDGAYMATAGGNIYGVNSVRLWDIKQGKLLKTHKGHKDWILSVAIGSNNKYIASGSADRTTAYYEMPGVNSMNLYRSVSGNLQISDAPINCVAIHPNGKFIASVSDDGKIIYMRPGMSTYHLLESQNKGLASVCFTPDGKQLIVGTHNGKVEVWSTETKTLITSFDSHIYNFNVLDSLSAIPYGTNMNIPILNTVSTVSVMSVNISPDGKYLASAGGAEVKIWETGTWKLIKTLDKNSGLTSVVISHNGKYIATGNADRTVKLWDVAEGKLLQTFSGHQNEVRSVVFSKEDNYIFSGSLDTQVKVWNLVTGKETLTYMVMANSDDDFMIMTPDGYYMATKGATKAVGFRVGNKTYPFEQFDLKFHRPDLVLKEISKIAYNSEVGSPNENMIKSYYAAYTKRLKKMGFTEDMLGNDLHLPEVKITSASLSAVSTNKNISFDVKASDSKYLLDRLNVYVNDVPIYGTNGIPLKDKKVNPLSQKINLELNQGKNTVKVTTLNNKGVESLSESFTINYQPATTVKPDLYIVALGISVYKEEKMNLNYAAKDARDIVKLFALQKDKYNKVVVDSILDHQATLQNILDLKKKLMQTKVDDQVVLFIAGHGLLDKNLDYFLATYDVNFSDPASGGLPYEKLEHLLDGIPARNKILLMDACHSGEVDKEEVTLATNQNTEQGEITFRAVPGVSVKNLGLENSFELMKSLFSDLRKGNGTTVISSAGGAEYAMEGAEWHNGIFTYCLLSGLKDKNADLNKDGKIMLSELQQYLQARVPELTNGKQRPTSRVENLSNDWQVW